MILAVHSAAAPDLELDELIEACGRRGVNALALAQGHAHGVDFNSAASAHEAATRLRSGSVHVAVFEIAAPNVAAADAAARVCAALDAPLHVREPLSPEWLIDFAAAGGRLVEPLELNAATQNVMAAARQWLAQHRTLPTHIILRGGGPEAVAHEGRGIGALLGWLALNGYSGTLVLAPTSPGVTPVWRRWLQHGKNWGCGSRKSDPSLVQIR